MVTRVAVVSSFSPFRNLWRTPRAQRRSSSSCHLVLIPSRRPKQHADYGIQRDIKHFKEGNKGTGNLEQIWMFLIQWLNSIYKSYKWRLLDVLTCQKQKHVIYETWCFNYFFFKLPSIQQWPKDAPTFAPWFLFFVFLSRLRRWEKWWSACKLMWITITWPWAKGRSRWGGNHEEPWRMGGEFFQKNTWRTAAWDWSLQCETCINLHRFQSIYIVWSSFGGMFLICSMILCFLHHNLHQHCNIIFVPAGSVLEKGRNRAAEVGVGIQRGTLGLELSFTKAPQKFHTKVPQKMARHEVMLQNIHLMPAWCVNTSETPVGKVTIGQRHDWRLETFTTFRQSSRRDWMPTLWSPELRQAFLKNDQENVL